MMDRKEVVKTARALLAEVAEGRGEAVLTTVGPDGSPHATWMGTVSADRLDELLTITSPESEKVRNIRGNAQVEWMFTDAAKDQVLYMRGRAEEATEAGEIKAAWEALEDKRRAFFLEYFNTGIGFAVLRTRVETVVLCLPKKNEKIEIPAKELPEE